MIDQGAIFLASTILYVIAICVIGGGVVMLNNIFSKFWCPIMPAKEPTVIKYMDPPPIKDENDYRFAGAKTTIGLDK